MLIFELDVVLDHMQVAPSTTSGVDLGVEEKTVMLSTVIMERSTVFQGRPEGYKSQRNVPNPQR